MKIKISDLIAEYLKEAGIKTVFGIIGSANSHIFDSINKLGYTEIVCVHHEQSAVMAMGAYFRTSGKLSAAIVTAGAGSSNAITGVLSNWADSIPGIIISGQEQSKFIEKYEGLRMYGIQGFNSAKMTKDITKYSTILKSDDDIQSILEYSHFVTINQRPGPVWLDVPFDVQSKFTSVRKWNLKSAQLIDSVDALPVTIDWDINYVVDKLKTAKRPLIWAGHGIRLSGMKDKFRDLTKSLKVPTILTWSGIDLLEDEHPYYFGRAGISGMRYSNFIVQNCDLLLVIGSRLSLLQTGYDINRFAPNAKIIVVENDPTELKKFDNKYDKVLQMDCRIFINELQKLTFSNEYTEWLEYCNKMKQKFPLLEECHKDGGENYLNSYHFINDLCDYIDDDAIIVTDMGTGLLSGHYSMRLKPNQIMFTSLGLGEMGYGLPGAIGAAKAYPGRQIICLNCDGGMMMNLQELQTIIHHKMNIKIVVFNNDGYLMIKHTQNMLFKGHKTSVDSNTGLSLPDYIKVGNSFGFGSWSLNNWSNFENTIKEWLSSNNPTLLEVYMDPNQEFLPKVKGIANEDGTITPASLEEMSPILPYKDIEDAMIAGVSENSKKICRPN